MSDESPVVHLPLSRANRVLHVGLYFFFGITVLVWLFFFSTPSDESSDARSGLGRFLFAVAFSLITALYGFVLSAFSTAAKRLPLVLALVALAPIGFVVFVSAIASK